MCCGRTNRVGEAETTVQRLCARVVVADMEIDRDASCRRFVQQLSQCLAAQPAALRVGQQRDVDDPPRPARLVNAHSTNRPTICHDHPSLGRGVMIGDVALLQRVLPVA